MKIKNNLFCLCVLAFSYANANNSTEAGTLCLDGALCISHTPSLSKLVESIPQCPQFILRQQILRDEKSSLTTTSPDEICSSSSANTLNYFDNAHEFESYLQQNPHFSNLNTSAHFSSCLSQGVLFSTGLGKTFHIQEKFLPEHKKQLAVAEYYSSLRRLSDGVERSLQNITAIDLMIGNNSLLEDVSCNSFDSLSQDITHQCRTAQQCPSNNSSSLQESSKDTLLALQAVEAIEKEIRRIKNVTFMKFTERQEKMKELRERQQNIQRFYPWISGKVFKEGYNAQDYTNYAESSDESKSEMEVQIAGLIQDQLTHTREKLKERTEDFLKASDCIKGEESLCEELDMEKVLAKAPPINHNEVFERERQKELKNKMLEDGLSLEGRQEELKSKIEEESLSPEERQEYRRLLTKVGSADGLFQQVSCLQTQRKAVSDVNRELALGVLDVGVVIGTMGLGTPIVAGRIALRLGSAVSKAKNLSKAKRIQNLGIFGTDVSFSAPYMKEAVNICEDKLNQLEETTAEPNNKLCEKLPIQVKHTSDLKSCILQASLASLPVTLPILGLSGMTVAKGLRGGKSSSPIPSNSTGEKAEEILGLRLSPEQQRAVEDAHLVGYGEKGKDGSIAGIGNYTEDQLRRKAEILRQAGFSHSQRRQLMEAGVVGDDLLISARRELEEALEDIRRTPEEPHFAEQGFKPELYKGYDKARELNEVKKWAEKIEADRYRTHIPYFADQVEKHIADFEKGFRKEYQDDPEFLAGRLKILEELKQEARKRVKDQNVTYDWWANFNIRLPMIAEEPDFIRELLRVRNKTKLNDLKDPSLREKEGFEVVYNKELIQTIKETMHFYVNKESRSFQELQRKLEQLDPEEILFEGVRTSKELERIYTNLTGSTRYQDYLLNKIMKEKGLYSNLDNLKTYEGMKDLLSDVVKVRATYSDERMKDLLSDEVSSERVSRLLIGSRVGEGLQGTIDFIRVKDKFPKEIMFFTTDELGIMAFNKIEDQSYFVGVTGMPITQIDGRTWSVFNFSSHDLTHIQLLESVKNSRNILDRIENIASKSDREKAEIALFMYRHEGKTRHFDPGLQNYLEGQYYVTPGKTYLASELESLPQSELKKIATDTKKATREMMKDTGEDRLSNPVRRFLDPDDLQKLLPDSIDVNNREEVKKYLIEAADVFADILLAR